MDSSAGQRHADSSTVVFEDGLGQRVPRTAPGAGAEQQVLVLRSAFAALPSFEFALRERVERLAAFHHPQFAPVVEVVRTTRAVDELSVVSEAMNGVRLSDLLRGAQARQVPVGINAALAVIGQLLPAVAALEDSGDEMSHGALGPERLIVTQDARVIIADHVFGSALEQLRYSRERYWSELRLALPPTASPRLDRRADVLQLGLVSLALILGRIVRLEEFPARVPDVLASTTAVSPQGGFEPLPAGLRGWLARALQIGPERPFATAAEARDAFHQIPGNGELLGPPAALAAFLVRYHAAKATPVESGALRGAALAARALPQSAPPPLQLMAAQTAQGTDRGADVLAIAAPVARKPVRASSGVTRRGAVTPTEVPALDPDRDARLDDGGGRWWWNWRLAAAFALLAVIVGASGSLGSARQYLPFVDTGHGTLELTSMPAGAEVFIDGESRGTTPLALTLPIGAHDVELRAGKARRAFGVIIGNGEKIAQQVKLQKSAPGKAPRASRSSSAAAKATPSVQAAPAPPVARAERAVTADEQTGTTGELSGASR